MMVIAAGMTAVQAQSKKEIIEMLTQKVDSLQKKLNAKNESVHALEIKLAKFEGASEAHNEIIKRLENRQDSLKDSLSAKTTLIGALTSERTKLLADLQSYQVRDQAWVALHDSLQSEIQLLRSNTASLSAPPKAMAKTPVHQSVTRTTPPVAVPANTPPAAAQNAARKVPASAVESAKLLEKPAPAASEDAGTDVNQAPTESTVEKVEN